MNHAVILGDADEKDLSLLSESFTASRAELTDTDAIDSEALTIVLHLERDPQPLERLREIAGRSNAAVICYSAPKMFIGGLDSLQARELASTDSQSGMRIDRFETLVGRTILSLHKADAATSAPADSQVTAAEESHHPVAS